MSWQSRSFGVAEGQDLVVRGRTLEDFGLRSPLGPQIEPQRERVPIIAGVHRKALWQLLMTSLSIFKPTYFTYNSSL